MFGTVGKMPAEIAAGFDFLCDTYGKSVSDPVKDQHEAALEGKLGQMARE